jgi:hypothetical protein
MTTLVTRVLPGLPLWEADGQATCDVAYDLRSSPEELPADPRHVAGVVSSAPAPHCGALHVVALGSVVVPSVYHPCAPIWGVPTLRSPLWLQASGVYADCSPVWGGF